MRADLNPEPGWASAHPSVGAECPREGMRNRHYVLGVRCPCEDSVLLIWGKQS